MELGVVELTVPCEGWRTERRLLVCVGRLEVSEGVWCILVLFGWGKPTEETVDAFSKKDGRERQGQESES